MIVKIVLSTFLIIQVVHSAVNECSATPCGVDQNCRDPNYDVELDFLCSCVSGSGSTTVGVRATCAVTSTPPVWTFPPSNSPSNGTASKEQGDIWGPVNHGNKWAFLISFIMFGIFCGVCSGYMFRKYGPKPSMLEGEEREMNSRRHDRSTQPPEYSAVEVREEEVDGWIAQVRYDGNNKKGIPITFYDQEKGRWMPWV